MIVKEPTTLNKIIRPKDAGGVSWGSDIQVLLKYKDKEMWRLKGRSISRRFATKEYVPGEIIMVRDAERHYRKYEPSGNITIQDNSRLSAKLFIDNEKTIDEFFECKIASLLEFSGRSGGRGFKERTWVINEKQRSKYWSMVVPLGGGWKDYPAGETLKEAVELAYLQAANDHTRYVSVSRINKHNTLKTNVYTLAGFNGRVFITKNGQRGLSNLYWNGVIPTPDQATEITGKYKKSLEFSI